MFREFQTAGADATRHVAMVERGCGTAAPQFVLYPTDSLDPLKCGWLRPLPLRLPKITNRVRSAISAAAGLLVSVGLLASSATRSQLRMDAAGWPSLHRVV